MNPEDVLSLPGRDQPVLCADGAMGILIQYPAGDCATCGVQVHGEEDARQIPCHRLAASKDGAMRETSAADTPKKPATNELLHMMLPMEWIKLGGNSIPR